MSKKHLSDEAIDLVAFRFKILSEPIRLRILQSLREGNLSVSQLTDHLRSSQPNISKHLKILHSAGILARRQSGNTIFYTIADESIFALCDLVCASIENRIRDQAEIFRAA